MSESKPINFLGFAKHVERNLLWEDVIPFFVGEESKMVKKFKKT